MGSRKQCRRNLPDQPTNISLDNRWSGAAQVAEAHPRRCRSSSRQRRRGLCPGCWSAVPQLGMWSPGGRLCCASSPCTRSSAACRPSGSVGGGQTNMGSESSHKGAKHGAMQAASGSDLCCSGRVSRRQAVTAQYRMATVGRMRTATAVVLTYLLHSRDLAPGRS